MDGIEPARKLNIGGARLKHRHSEIKADEIAIIVTAMTNDAIGRLACGLHAQMRSIDVLVAQCGLNDPSSRICGNHADIGRLGSKTAHMDSDIDTVTARKHFPTRNVTIDDIIAHRRDFDHSYFPN